MLAAACTIAIAWALVAAALCWLLSTSTPRLLLPAPGCAAPPPQRQALTPEYTHYYTNYTRRPVNHSSSRGNKRAAPTRIEGMSTLRRVIKKANDCRRFKAKISYQGEAFCGWQKQKANEARSFRTMCVSRPLACTRALCETPSVRTRSFAKSPCWEHVFRHAFWHICMRLFVFMVHVRRPTFLPPRGSPYICDHICHPSFLDKIRAGVYLKISHLHSFNATHTQQRRNA